MTTPRRTHDAKEVPESRSNLQPAPSALASVRCGMLSVEKHKRLSAADRDELGGRLEKAYTEGISIAALAQEYGTSAGRVRLLLLERGVALRSRGGSRRKPNPMRDEQAKAIAGEYDRGASLAELAQVRGVSIPTIRRLVLAGGGELRPRGRRRP